MKHEDLFVVILLVDMRLINEKIAWIPRRCLVCGEEFNWENILTESKKYCPLCHEIYPGYANFCAFHNDPKIGLIPS